MNFKCPKCNTGYNLPESVFANTDDKNASRKMSCYKCKTIFSVAIRPKNSIKTSSAANKKSNGYEEFVSPDALNDHKNQTSDEQELCFEIFDSPDVDSPFDSHKAEEQLIVDSEAVNEKAIQQKAIQSKSVAKTDAWTSGNVLDLRDYTFDNSRSFAKFFIAIIVFIILVSGGFIGFIASQNDWDLKGDMLSEQISFAFYGGDPVLEIPESLKGLNASIFKAYRFRATDKRSIAVIKGTVQNDALTTRANIVLKAEMIDPNGKIRATAVAPCGRIIKNRKIRRSKKGKNLKIYNKRGKPFNCQIKSGDSAEFKMFFDDLPDDYNDKFRVEVKAISATVADDDDEKSKS